MISGIGLDIIELERIEKLDQRSSRFRHRILTKTEHVIYESLEGHRRTEYLAGRFTGKEAFAKALGTGIGSFCSFMDIEIIPTDEGKPELYFKGMRIEGFISITHTKTIAAAQVLLLSSERS